MCSLTELIQPFQVQNQIKFIFSFVVLNKFLSCQNYENDTTMTFILYKYEEYVICKLSTLSAPLVYYFLFWFNYS